MQFLAEHGADSHIMTAGHATLRAEWDWSDFDEGEAFTDRDVRTAKKVCVLGRTVVRELFQGMSPIGKQVRVLNVSLKVIGVLSRRGANAAGMTSYLERRGIHIRNKSSDYGCDGCIRVTTGVVEHTERCLEAMEDYLCGAR